MSKGPATAVDDRDARETRIASSAVVVGTARMGDGALLAEGAVIRSSGT
jgi:carbonic anhydrase/acetyltransferase-like protein (isoleucine patch superfamily)